jgi:acyl-coenzyme A thioesterase PaaI-like protein
MSDDEFSEKIEILGVSEEHLAMIPQLITRGLTNYWGAVFEHLSPKRVVASLVIDERHLQPWGILHGGVSVTLAESWFRD